MKAEGGWDYDVTSGQGVKQEESGLATGARVILQGSAAASSTPMGKLITAMLITATAASGGVHAHQTYSSSTRDD